MNEYSLAKVQIYKINPRQVAGISFIILRKRRCGFRGLR